MLRITYILGDEASGKSSIASGLRLLNQNLGWEIIDIDEGLFEGVTISPAGLLVSLRGRISNEHKTHVILIGERSKQHLDALLASYPHNEYLLVTTNRGFH